MIVVMQRGASQQQVQHMVERVEGLGLKAHVIVGAERTVIAAVGEKREHMKESLESGPGVAEVLPILAPYKVASREVKPEPTQVVAGSLRVGAGVLGIIAGPCSVESEQQIVSTAKAVKAAGATGLRGGAFKPRTSPYSFQGLKEDGLKMLATARQETGLAVVTEVMSTEDVDMVAEYADVLQIGARNMQNYRLLEAVGKSPSCRTAETRTLCHDGRTAARRGIHTERRKPTRHVVRARHSHIRNAYAIHAALSQRFPISITKRTCPWWSIRATERDTRIWSPTPRPRRSPPAQTD